jgi:hypothetical protein
MPILTKPLGLHKTELPPRHPRDKPAPDDPTTNTDPTTNGVHPVWHRRFGFVR